MIVVMKIAIKKNRQIRLLHVVMQNVPKLIRCHLHHVHDTFLHNGIVTIHLTVIEMPTHRLHYHFLDKTYLTLFSLRHYRYC